MTHSIHRSSPTGTRSSGSATSKPIENLRTPSLKRGRVRQLSPRAMPGLCCRQKHSSAADGADNSGLTLRSRSGPLREGLKCLPRLLTWTASAFDQSPYLGSESIRASCVPDARCAHRSPRGWSEPCAWIVAAHRDLFWKQLRAARHSLFSGRLSHGSLVPRRVLPSPKRFAATSARHE